MRPYDATRTALFSPERAPTLFRSGTKPSLIQLCTEAARLAYYRAEESVDESGRLNDALQRIGFSPAQLFSHPGTDGQGFGAWSSDMSLLAFRGTEPDSVGDLVTDAQTTLGPSPLAGGLVHRGFAHTAEGLWQAVEPWLDSVPRKPKRIAICGHSLGAAIATLLAVPAGATDLITIGSPRVGDATFAEGLKRTDLDVVRIVNCCDVVTEVPPSWARLLPFVHVSDPLYIDREGAVMTGTSDEAVTEDRAIGRKDYLLNYAFRFGTLITRDLADHSPANYLRAFWP